MPCESTPRIVAAAMRSPPGSSAPMVAQGASMPTAALGAPQTIAQRLGRADVDQAHAKAIGVRMRIDLVDPPHDDAGEGWGGRFGRLDFEPRHRQLLAQARGVERGIDHRAQPAFGELHPGVR